MSRSLGFKFLNGLDTRGIRTGELNAGSLSVGNLAVSTIEGQNGGGVSFTQPISNVTFEQVTIEGGTINNVSIGTEIPGIGYFTNVNILGDVTITGNINSGEGSEANLGNLQIVENTISAVAPLGDGDIILVPLGTGDVIVNGPFVVNATTGSLDVTINADDLVDINGENQVNITSDSGQICIESATLIKLVAGTQIQLTPTSNILVATDKPLTFANGSSSIVSDGTDLTISGSAGDVNINANTAINLNQNTIITGNLTVSGSTTTINTTTFEAIDPVIKIGENTVLATKDRGIEFCYNDGTAKIGFFGWDRSVNKFIGLTGATNISEEFSGTLMDACFKDMELTSLTTDTICGDPGLTLKTTGGADININASTNGDVNIPTDIGLTFGGDSQKIESNGTDLTIDSGNDIDLTATSDVNIPTDIGLTFGGDSQKIESNGTDLTIDSGNDIDLTATNDVNIPENVGLTFGNDTEKIESNGTDLTIDSGNDINLTATNDVNVPENVGLTFGNDTEKIESNGTDLTIDSGNDVNLTATNDVNIPTDVGLTFGSDTEKIEGNGTGLTIESAGTIDVNSTGDITLDSEANVTIEAISDISLNADIAVNIPVNIPLTFGGNDSTNIQGDGTDLNINSNNDIDIAATNIDLAATVSVIVPITIPVVLGNTNTEIHGTISTVISQAADGGNVNLFAESDNDIYLVPAVNGDVIIPEDVGLQFGTNNGNRIEYDGTDLCIYAINDICLDAGGDVSIVNNMVIGGDLTVTGALNTSSSVGSDVDTPIIQLGDQINFIVDSLDETPGANQNRLRVASPHHLIATDGFTVRESSEASADGEQTIDSIPVLVSMLMYQLEVQLWFEQAEETLQLKILLSMII